MLATLSVLREIVCFFLLCFVCQYELAIHRLLLGARAQATVRRRLPLVQLVPHRCRSLRPGSLSRLPMPHNGTKSTRLARRASRL